MNFTGVKGIKVIRKVKVAFLSISSPSSLLIFLSNSFANFSLKNQSEAGNRDVQFVLPDVPELYIFVGAGDLDHG